MRERNNDDLTKALVYWHSGQPEEAGRLIFEKLAVYDRPSWAAKILRLVLDESGADRLHFQRILETADNPRWWANGHRCFDLLRRELLRYDDLQRTRGLSKREEEFASLLCLAELVAKVTYNAVDPPDPFDEDSGWWIAVALKAFVEMWKSTAFADVAWKTLIGNEHSQH